MEFTKIYHTVMESSLWEEEAETRIVFFTLLLKMDPTSGFVKCWGVERLAAMANVGLAETEVAVGILEGPDKRDKNQPHQGRRIRKVEGGWVVINGPEYFLKSMREQWAKAQRDYRARKKAGEGGVHVKSGGSLAERLEGQEGV